MRLAAYQAVIYQVTATANNPIALLLVPSSFTLTNITITSCQLASTLTSAELTTCKKNLKIIEYEIMQLLALLVDGKQKYYLKLFKFMVILSR